ncbi:MAG: SDR family oxidoreductase [Actinomycetota bacterium]|jgi:2-deoxy-D-gluconate 3-dehydrogenase|nr:SDR family oxidoreductase [Actinomycetota bacterium]
MTEPGYLSRQFGLEGRRALVTGARTGIGRAFAHALAAAGADLVLWGRSAPGLEEVAAELSATGAEVQTVGADLADLAELRGVADELAAATRIDILVHCAGLIRRGPLDETARATWQEVLRVNLDAAFELAQAFAPSMVSRRSGKIVNVASLLSFQGGRNVAAYAASKHGLVGLTKALSNELAPHGVNVNAIAPGYIETGNTAPLRADPARSEQILGRIPAGRWGKPEDLAGAVCFLCSDAAAYVHGHVLVVDGGWLAW